MSFATRTNCISGGHTIPVWELPIVQDWHKSRFIVGEPIHATPLVLLPSGSKHPTRSGTIYESHPTETYANLKLVAQLPRAGSAGHPTAIQLMSVHLYPIYRSFPFG